MVEKPARIFISYARGDDPAFVRRLRDDLLARAGANGDRPLKLFYDKQDMPSRGKSFLLEIRDFIGDPETERLLLVVGPRAVDSPFVQAEWRAAHQRCVSIVPLLRLGRPRHARPRNARTVDLEDYGLIPAEIQGTGVHAIDFRERRGSLPGRTYEQAFEELWRVLGDRPVLGELAASVPSLPGNFVARGEYLKLLHQYVLPDANQPVNVQLERRFVVLTGMGGVGKSVTAAAFCRSCKTRRSFKDGIAWVRMGSNPQLPVELVDLFGDSRRPFASRRTPLRDMSCLVVLDDVTDPGHVARFKSELGDSGRLLVTTRDTAVATALNAQRCDVDLLTEAESLALLADWSGLRPNELPPTARDALAECGRLALAISLVGAMMKGKPLESWKYVVADLKNANLDEIRHRFPDYEHPDLLRALKVSVDSLDSRDDDEGRRARKMAARQRYLELAIFPGNTPLPPAVLATYWSSGGVNESIAAKLMDLFVERNLARRDVTGHLVLHDLQHDYLVSEQRDALKDLHRRFIDAHRMKKGWHEAADAYLVSHLARHLRDAGLVDELTSLINRQWMHVRLAAGGTHRGFADDVEMAIEASTHDTSSAGLLTLARACLVLGAITDLATEVPPAFIGTLARTGQADRAIHQASLIRDERSRAITLSEVAAVLIEQGGGLATGRRLIEQLLEEVRDSKDTRLRIQTGCWAARCLAELQLADQAVAAIDCALELLDEAKDENLRAWGFANLSRAYFLMNRRADARRIARKAFRAAQSPAAFGRDRLLEVALVLRAVGDEKLFSQAVARLRVVDDQNAEALLLVAEELGAAGRKIEATALVKQVCASIAKLRDPRDRPAMLSSAALTFARIGNAREAAALASRALANVSKADAIGQASALLGNLAALEIKLGRPRRGAQLARRALRRVDGNTAEKLEATAAVAQQLSDAGQQKEARALLEKSMAEAAHVRYPWSERRTAALLGEALIRAGKVELGVAQIDGLSEHYGSRGRTQRRFARVLAELGAWDDAESIARSTEDLYQSDALRSVAVELSRHGLHERAHDVAMAIDSSRAQAEALCETLDLTDKAACRTGRELAEQAGDSAALAILAERLASHGDDAAAREIARSALQIAQSY